MPNSGLPERGEVVHTMIRVEDLEQAVDWYTEHLGYVEHSRSVNETFTLSFVGPETAADDPHETLVELTYNHDDRTYTMGDAWGHLAVRVDDVYDAYDKLMAEGVTDYRDPDSCGGNYAFVKDPDGHEIELVERDEGARWGIDHTMIRVENADSAIGWYTRKLDYDLVNRSEHDSFSLYFMKPPEAPDRTMDIELTYNHDGRSYEMGDAWGHFAIAYPDLEEAWETLMAREAEDYRDPESCDWHYAFTKDPDGHEHEVVVRG